MKSSITKYAGFLLLILSVAGGIIYNTAKGTKTEIVTTATATHVPEFLNEKETTALHQVWIYVDIKGAVARPGVYPMKSGDRVFEAIEKAGGLTEAADTGHLNLAMTLSDQMVVIIPETETVAITTVADETATIVVEIKGEVRYPGVYELPSSSRVRDLIIAAGGLTIFADTHDVSLAATLADGMAVTIMRLPVESVFEERMILVEIRGEVKNPDCYEVSDTALVRDLIYLAGGLTQDASLEGVDLLKPLASGERIIIKKFTDSVISEAGGDQQEMIDGLVNINTANLDTLMTLSGIGIVLGQRIIDYRAEYGDFASIEDVMFVSGIKESIFAKIKDEITVG